MVVLVPSDHQFVVLPMFSTATRMLHERLLTKEKIGLPQAGLYYPSR
jgi:hypothetical protein